MSGSVSSEKDAYDEINANQSLDPLPERPDVVRLRANLLQPVQFAGHTVVPFGWERCQRAATRSHCP